jgi:hypothetical protein
MTIYTCAIYTTITMNKTQLFWEGGAMVATYEGVSRSLWTSRLERELQMVQLSTTRCYFVSQSSEFCYNNPLCCFSMSVFCCCLFHYQLSLETFVYALVLPFDTT